MENSVTYQSNMYNFKKREKKKIPTALKNMTSNIKESATFSIKIICPK